MWELCHKPHLPRKTYQIQLKHWWLAITCLKVTKWDIMGNKHKKPVAFWLSKRLSFWIHLIRNNKEKHQIIKLPWPIGTASLMPLSRSFDVLPLSHKPEHILFEPTFQCYVHKCHLPVHTSGQQPKAWKKITKILQKQINKYQHKNMYPIYGKKLVHLSTTFYNKIFSYSIVFAGHIDHWPIT